MGWGGGGRLKSESAATILDSTLYMSCYSIATLSLIERGVIKGQQNRMLRSFESFFFSPNYDP